jgi:hypothetical protein
MPSSTSSEPVTARLEDMTEHDAREILRLTGLYWENLWPGMSADEARALVQKASQVVATEPLDYAAWTPYDQGPPRTYVCPRCSAIVKSREDHAAWHDRSR